jgi:membrane protease subunit HflC
MMIKAIIGAVVVIAALIVWSQTTFRVDETNQVIITEFGEYIKTIDEPGLNFKIPFIQTVHRFEKRVLVSDAPPAEYLTLDKKRLVIDSYTRWQIIDPLQFFKTVRNEAGALARLDGIVFSELRTELSAHSFKEIIGAQREPIMETVAQRASVIMAEFGIDIVDVRIKRADLPPEVQASVYARMVAERERIGKRYRAEGEEQARIIRASADKEAVIILADAYKVSETLRGEGDAEATRVYAEAFEQDPEFYRFLRTLEAYEKFMVGGTTLVLGSDSELFKYLESPAAGE